MSWRILLGVAAASVAATPAYADQLDQILASIPWPAGHVTKWERVKGADGSVIAVETNSIQHVVAGATVFIYVPENYDYYFPPNMKQLLFDCRGRFTELGTTTSHYAPPQSVIGIIGAMACAEPKPKAADYCRDFTQEACERIKAVVEKGVRPAYCRPGFGRLDSGLSLEELRICYVMVR